MKGELQPNPGALQAIPDKSRAFGAVLIRDIRDTKENNMQDETTKPNTKPPDREAVRVLAIELGAREAARRLGLNPNTVLSWAKRYNWGLPNRKGGATKASANAISLQSKPGDVLLTMHKELEGRTKTGLAQATAKASEHAAEQDGATNLNCSGKLRDLASAAARVFGWDNGAPGVQFNQLVVSQEQLEQIRALRAS